jgi:hypothetical protein
MGEELVCTTANVVLGNMANQIFPKAERWANKVLDGPERQGRSRNRFSHPFPSKTSVFCIKMA